MEAESPRIDELRRRVQQDPASIAFAHLADEYRRAGDLQEAVKVCRAGLEHHPAYLLAHVTLGRALMELAEYPEARTEFEYVLRLAPDNLIALKGMEELQQKEGPAPPNVAPVTRAPLKLRRSTDSAAADHGSSRDAPLGVSVPEAASAPLPQAPVVPPPQAEVASPAEAQAQITPPQQVQVASPAEAEAQITPPPQAEVASPAEAQMTPPPQVQVASPPETVDPALEELQGWLAALDTDRGEREDSPY